MGGSCQQESLSLALCVITAGADPKVSLMVEGALALVMYLVGLTIQRTVSMQNTRISRTQKNTVLQ